MEQLRSEIEAIRAENARRWVLIRNICISAIIVVALGCAGGIYVVAKQANENSALLARIEAEGKERRSQSCDRAEREYVRAVGSLALTYTYIENLPPEEIKLSLNQLLIKQLPETERRAKDATPPPYCLEKGIGSDKPYPKFPEHKDFSSLIIKGK